MSSSILFFCKLLVDSNNFKIIQHQILLDFLRSFLCGMFIGEYITLFFTKRFQLVAVSKLESYKTEQPSLKHPVGDMSQNISPQISNGGRQLVS